MTATLRLVHNVIFLFVLFCTDTTLSQQFPSDLYEFIPENQANGSLITSFNVTDPNNDVITLGIYDDFTHSCVYLTTTNNRPGFVTGNVYLINPDNFDYDRGQRDVRLAFTASDGAKMVTGFVHIYVSDVNDNAPVFKSPAYMFEIPENTTVSSTHNASITATDADDGVNKAFVYSLQSAGLYQGVFSIDPNNGILTLNEALDYEALTLYQYTIKAVDKGTPSMTGSAEIIIKVSDVQDTPPGFQGQPYLISIIENSSWVGSNILAQDGDRGIPRDITYRLYNDSQCSSLFTLDNKTGKLSLKDGHVLDRDTGVLKDNQGVCRLQIKASEVIYSGEPTVNSIASTTVTVTVEDIDDNVPTFNLSHYNAYVDEEVSNIPLTIDGADGIYVADLDQRKNSEFDLTVNYANGTKCTGIESIPSHIIGHATVLLRLVHEFKFDYETEEMVELQVVATGRVKNSMTTTCNVTVYINNTNDNDPVFEQSDYNAIIDENPEHGTSVIVITAKDDDKGKNGNLTYTLKGSSLFVIDPQNGTVCTIGSPGDLDRETRDTYYLTVVVTDGGGKRAVVSLTVTLSDVNDNRPEFIYTTVEMSINENTITFIPNIAIKANDNDEAGTNNSMVRYRLDIPDPNLQSNFTINDTTGELIATEPLDYENLTYPSENGQIRLIVIAYDLGTPSLESNITVIINAHDENDNTPKFLHDYYDASIPENSKQGHPVKTVSAEDDNATSQNNVTRYFIEKGGCDKFRIDAIKGIITVDLNARFDRETQDLYILTVIAADIGTPPLTGTVNVSVTITDVNDEDPDFGESQDTASVKEDIPVGTIIKTYNATDADENSNLGYIILGMKATDMNGDSVNTSLIENMFDVVSDNGSVFVSSELDRETASQVDITLLVNDTMCAENCPQNDTTTLTVTVDDVNDVAPQFSQDVYEVAIPESYAVGRVVITLTATDVDIIGDGPFYKVISDPYSSFTIKEKRTGTITTTENLDRETHPVHNITVSASDGVNNSTAIVIINVTDVNDNAPQFLPFDSTVNITEGNYTDNSIWVAKVNATDADEGENATVKYRLPPNHNNFWINKSTGDIYAVGDVDREAKPAGEIKLTIIAENSDKDPESLRNTTELTLLILDVNDNRPEFSGKTYHGSGQETEVKNGTWLLQVTATDSDNGLNGTDGITYEIEQNTNGTDFFYINDTNGMIYANDKMVNNVGTFLLNVTARDGGHPFLMSSVEVFIEIVDENNNQPEFNIDNYMFSILECERPGINITRIAATDKDKGLNGKIMFSLTREPGSDRLPFTIGKDNGQISLNRSVTNKERPEYKFTVNATDQGSPMRLTTLSPEITIQIRDVNDKPPQFPQPTRKVSVMENTNDTVVTTVEAYDNDSDSITTYSINISTPTPTAQTSNVTTTTPTSPLTRSDIDCGGSSISLHVPLDLLPSGQQVTWNDPACVVSNNGTHLTGDIDLGECGTYVFFNATHVIFENELVSHASTANSTSGAHSVIDYGNGPDSVIVVQCVYPRREQESLGFRPIQGQVRLYEKTLGHMQVHMREARDVRFDDMYPSQTEPRVVHLNDPIYIKLDTEQGNTTKVAINVDRCLATPSPSPLDTDFQELTDNGCPALPSVTIHSSPVSEVHLSFQAFKFTNHPSAPVYVHCEVYVCPLSDPHCVTGCTDSVARTRRAATGGIKTHLVSTGPFPVADDKDQGGFGGESTALVAVTGLCAVLAVAATIFGVMAWRGRRRLSLKEPLVQ